MATSIKTRKTDKVLYREYNTTWLVQDEQVIDQEFNIYPLTEWVDITGRSFYTPSIRKVFTGDESLQQGLITGILTLDEVRVNTFCYQSDLKITLTTKKDHESGQLLVKFEKH